MNIYEKLDLYKSRIDAVRPFEGEILSQIKEYYKIGLTYTSNALEGNTLSESETKILIEDGLTAGGKPLKDTFEALGHAKAYDFMFELLDKHTISEDDIKTLHNLFYNNIDPVLAGAYRNRNVIITGSSYPVADFANVQREIDELVSWMQKEREQYHPVEFAAKLHQRFVFIHPFIDGNGRVSRLLMNTALIQDGYMMAVIPPVLRNEYIMLLDKAHTDTKPFDEFIAERVLESDKEIIRLLHIDMDQEQKM